MSEIYLKKMTSQMFHEFFKEYENDSDLYLNKSDYYTYVYDYEKVELYINRQIQLNRICLAIMLKDEIIGEIKLYDINNDSLSLGITLKNDHYKNKGYGTKAELLAIEYVFNELNKSIIYADSIITNKRSQHVLEKVGFELIKQDSERKYYQIKNI